MGLVEGTISLTRFMVTSMTDTPDFDRVPYKEPHEDSNITETEGFLPYANGEEYQTAHQSWFFRVATFKRIPCKERFQEVYRDLLKAESEQGPVSVATKRALKSQAEDIARKPGKISRKRIDCYLWEGSILYAGTTSKGDLGTICELLAHRGRG